MLRHADFTSSAHTRAEIRPGTGSREPSREEMLLQWTPYSAGAHRRSGLPLIAAAHSAAVVASDAIARKT